MMMMMMMMLLTHWKILLMQYLSVSGIQQNPSGSAEDIPVAVTSLLMLRLSSPQLPVGPIPYVRYLYLTNRILHFPPCLLFPLSPASRYQLIHHNNIFIYLYSNYFLSKLGWISAFRDAKSGDTQCTRAILTSRQTRLQR